jgi:hypothetical protein
MRLLPGRKISMTSPSPLPLDPPPQQTPSRPVSGTVRRETERQEPACVSDLVTLLVVLRRAGVAVRLVDELPPDADSWHTHEQVAALGPELLVLREAEIAHEDLWALVHEAAHALVPESQHRDDTGSDLRAEILGPFLITELGLAREVAASSLCSLRHLERLIAARQIEDLRCALHGDRFSPPLLLRPAEATLVEGRLRALHDRYGRVSQLEVFGEHQAAREA